MSVQKIAALVEEARRELAVKVATLLTTPELEAAPAPKKRGRPKGSKTKKPKAKRKSASRIAATVAGAPIPEGEA